VIEPHTNGHRRNNVVLRTGKGKSIAQHGELFQGQIEDPTNQNRRRCLLSLPCKALYSEATFQPDQTDNLTVFPQHKQKAKKVVELTREYLNAPWVGGRLAVKSTVPEAKGCGSSTADCVAASIALADALGCVLCEEELARLVVEAEVASDNFMFHNAVLFAHREGVVLENYASQLPSLEVLGVDTAEECHVDTLDYPPAVYSWRQLQSFCTLTGALRRAVRRHDRRLLGRVATASACINEQFLPKRMFKEVKQIADHVGALGIAVAHSGTVLSVLFDPQESSVAYKLDRMRRSLDELGISRILQFQT
jgi:uncharacterized protein involved in propanediol utilization